MLPIKQDYNTESQQKLHSLIKRREQLILHRNQEIARLDKANNNIIKQLLEEVLSYLGGQLITIESAIKDPYNNDRQIKNKFDRLTSIPGVDTVLATAVVCEIPEIGNIDLRKLTA